MTEDEINTKGFELIPLIETIANDNGIQKTELIGSAKERGFLDWSNKLAAEGIEKTLNQADEPISIYFTSKDNKVGFNENNYSKFVSLILSVRELQIFNGKVSFEFIKRKTFEWALNIHEAKVAGSKLITHLTNEFQSNISEHQYYFPVINLEIESSFKIGNVEFTYFTQEYFDNLFESLKKLPTPITEKEFEDIFIKDYKGQVLAKIKVLAERDHSEYLAQNECSLAVDVLKIYGLTTTIPEKKTMFDLNYRLNYQVKSNFLSQEISKSENLLLNLKFNNPTFNITAKQIVFAKANGMETFSHFITLKNQDELYKLIIQAIGLLGSSLSNWDLHLRIINLITLLESLLLKDEENNDMERKVKARISKIISDDHKEKEALKDLFTTIYKVRHKMVHKAIKLSINTTELMNAQVTVINLLLKLMRFNIVDKHTTKASLIETLNQINS